MKPVILIGVIVAAVALTAQAGAVKAKTKAATEAPPASAAPEATVAPATLPAPATQPAAATELGKAFNDLVAAYLNSRHAELPELLKSVSGKNYTQLKPDQQKKVAYVRRVSAEERPPWWKDTKSASNVSFPSTIWGRSVVANYMPAEGLGAQGVIGVKDGKVVTLVTWRPTMVDNPREAEGVLSKKLGITKGDIGEVVVWHELGHNYFTNAFSAADVFELYMNHEILFSHLQEFFADMTALHHGSPRARLVTLLLRLDSLDPPPYVGYREQAPHTRAANAIGAILLAEVLADPSKWPHVHFPPAVPEKDFELKTIVYLYEHFDKNWSLDEDMALRELAGKVVRTSGDAIFRSKGMVPLPNKLTFCLMEAEDRELQVKRDAWVKDKLQKAIESGRGDKPEPTTTKTRVRPMRIEVPYY